MSVVDVEDIEDLGHRSIDIEKVLANDYAVSWTYEPDFEISQIDIARSLENQARSQPINEERLEFYTELWAADAKFPPIIGYWAGRGKNKKFVNCDGNHRVGSAVKAGRTTIPVYILDAKTRPETIDLITQTINAYHGQNMTHEEQIRAAMHLMDNKTSARIAARRTGLSEFQVQAARRKAKVEQRADEAGVNPAEWDAIPVTSRTPLNSLGDNESFRAVAKLAYQAKLGAPEVSELVADINDQKEPTKRRALIRAKEGEFQDRIQRNGSGMYNTSSNRGAPGPRQHISKILSTYARLPESTAAVAKQYGKAECATMASDIADVANYFGDLAKEFARKA